MADWSWAGAEDDDEEGEEGGTSGVCTGRECGW